MLNDYKVLRYVKDNIGFPFHKIELEDDDILNYIKEYTLPEFSHYFPEKRKMNINLNTNPKVQYTQNEYYLQEVDGLEILNVKDVIFSAGNLMYNGHPPMGVFSFSELKEWALNVEVSTMIKQFSSFDYTWEFKHPNILRISPVVTSEAYALVEYEREQSKDFRNIPHDIQLYFLKLALADTMIRIGRIRKRYEGNMRTPFGEIPISAEIFDEGKEMKREVLDKLETMMIPNIIVDFG